MAKDIFDLSGMFFLSLFFENFVHVCDELSPDVAPFPPTPPSPHFINSSTFCPYFSLIIHQVQLAAHKSRLWSQSIGAREPHCGHTLNGVLFL